MGIKLDFSQYKGKTRLREWWQIVKEHLTILQDGINDEAATRDRVDTAMAQNLADEINARKQGDAANAGSISQLNSNLESEISNRKDADAKLQNQINSTQKTIPAVDTELSETSENPVQNKVVAAAIREMGGLDLEGKIEELHKSLFGKIVTNEVEVILPVTPPEPSLVEGEDTDYAVLDIPYTIKANGEIKRSGTAHISLDINAMNSDYYILGSCDVTGESFSLGAVHTYNQYEYVSGEEEVTLNLYRYREINIGFKSSEYFIENYNASLTSENSDETGNTYTIYSKCVDKNTLNDLLTTAKDSFFAAVNELAKKPTDGQLSDTSTNPVQNKAVAEAVKDIKTTLGAMSDLLDNVNGA